MNALTRLLNKPKYRVTRHGDTGFNLRRRIFRLFYGPVCARFSTISEAFEFLHRETGSDYVCVEMYPPSERLGSLSLPVRSESPRRVVESDIRSVMSSGPARVAPPITGAPAGYQGRLVVTPGPSKADESQCNIIPSMIIAAAILADDDRPAQASEVAPSPLPSTDVPLEAPSPSPSDCGASCDTGSCGCLESSPSSSYDCGSSYSDSGSSSCDCGGGSSGGGCE